MDDEAGLRHLPERVLLTKARLRVVNNDERWEPKERCRSTIVHLGKKYGCVYGKGHDAGEWACDHGAEARTESGHVSHSISWETGDDAPRVTPGEWWSEKIARAVRAEGCRIAEVRYV